MTARAAAAAGRAAAGRAERADVVLALAETFRAHGFAGASLSVIGDETGLGRGSLYHFFPGGKEEMAGAVLDEVQSWFEGAVFARLRAPEQPEQQLRAALAAVEGYFTSRRLVCLFAALALGGEREQFAGRIRRYFSEWVDALAVCLTRAGREQAAARALAVDLVSVIHGALVVGRAFDDGDTFTDVLARVRERVLPLTPAAPPAR